MALQLLKRPRPLPAFRDEEKGIYAQWKIKVGHTVFRKLIPLFSRGSIIENQDYQKSRSKVLLGLDIHS